MTSQLYQPTQLGDLNLAHRIVLAPLTRLRADYESAVPITPLVAEYYAQRGSVPGTLLISEGTYIDQRTGGIGNAPGIWSQEQIEAWKEIVEKVHANGSFIFLQLWVLGRAAYPKELEKNGGWPYVSSSDVPLSTHPAEGPNPRPLSIAEIQEYAELYKQASHNAVHLAGFDGVEVHGANGYLPDQFLSSNTNLRDDAYGGTPEKRATFALQMVQACVDAVGESKVGLRISPWNTYQEVKMPDPGPTFTHLVTELAKQHPSLAYLHVVEPRADGYAVLAEVAVPWDDFQLSQRLRDLWNVGNQSGQRKFLTAGGYTRGLAEDTADRRGDLVVFGRAFLANPDLPLRLKKNIPLTAQNTKTTYIPGSTEPLGYTDYPFAEEEFNGSTK